MSAQSRTRCGETVPIFSAEARMSVSAARRGQGALHRGLLGVAGGQSRLGVHAGDAEQEKSADTFCAASTARAPQVTAECLKTRPPEEELPACWDGRAGAAAIVGLWVITVARGRVVCWATARAVVPPSRMTARPGRPAPPRPGRRHLWRPWP